MDDYIVIRNDDEKQIKVNKKIIAAIIGFVVIISSILLIGFLNRGPKLPEVVKITNYDEISGEFPAETEGKLRAAIYSVLKRHFDVPDITNGVEASVRADTLEKSVAGDFFSVSVIIDVEEYQQTYEAVIGWSDDYPMDIIIECARRDVSKFPETMCYGTYRDGDSVKPYLPYEGRTESGKEFSLKFGYYNEDGSENVIAFIDNCKKENTYEEAVAEAKKYISSFGINLEKVDIKVSYIYKRCRVR